MKWLHVLLIVIIVTTPILSGCSERMKPADKGKDKRELPVEKPATETPPMPTKGPDGEKVN